MHFRGRIGARLMTAECSCFSATPRSAPLPFPPLSSVPHQSKHRYMCAPTHTRSHTLARRCCGEASSCVDDSVLGCLFRVSPRARVFFFLVCRRSALCGSVRVIACWRGKRRSEAALRLGKAARRSARSKVHRLAQFESPFFAFVDGGRPSPPIFVFSRYSLRGDSSRFVVPVIPFRQFGALLPPLSGCAFACAFSFPRLHCIIVTTLSFHRRLW